MVLNEEQPRSWPEHPGSPARKVVPDDPHVPALVHSLASWEDRDEEETLEKHHGWHVKMEQLAMWKDQGSA